MAFLEVQRFPASGGPVCFLQSETVIQTKRNEDISSCLRDEILTNFWIHFGRLGQGKEPGVSPTAILNEKKALGTRLHKPGGSQINCSL